jgi:hypothetical protein
MRGVESFKAYVAALGYIKVVEEVVLGRQILRGRHEDQYGK